MKIWFLAAVTALVTGCSDKPQVREYVTEREEQRLFTTDVLRGEFATMPFDWTVPSDWKSAENDQFSRKAWSAGPSSQELQARITISDLPASAGLSAQVERWAGQAKLGAEAAAEIMSNIEEVSVGDLSGSWVELQGPEETILGFIIPHGDKLWVIKYRSVNSTAAQLRSSFRGFCESLKVEKTGSK